METCVRNSEQSHDRLGTEAGRDVRGESLCRGSWLSCQVGKYESFTAIFSGLDHLKLFEGEASVRQRASVTYDPCAALSESPREGVCVGALKRYVAGLDLNSCTYCFIPRT